MGTNGDKPRYDNSFRKEVAEFAIKYSNKKAMEKYDLSQTMVRRSIKLLQKPEMCAVCGKEFGWQSGLVRHMKNVHNDDSMRVSNENNIETALDDIDPENKMDGTKTVTVVSNLDMENKNQGDNPEIDD